MQTSTQTNRRWKMPLLAGLLTLLATGASIAQQMNYQGRLTDGAGNAVSDAQYSITFDIYDSATGGTKQWGPQVIPADTVQGRFNVILGPTDSTSRSIVDAFNGGNKYLQITFQGAPILPRQQILSSPTAFFAQQAGQLASVFVVNGNVGIGTATPGTPLHVVRPNPGAVGPLLRLDNTAGTVGDKARIEFATAGDPRAALEWDIISGGEATWNFLDTFNGIQSRLFIAANGNMGIGTTTPTVKLDVAGSANVTGNANVAGSVGIGTTAPGTRLHVAAPSSKTTSGDSRAFAVLSNEPIGAIGSPNNPFGLDIRLVGAAALTNRAVFIQSTDWNTADGGNILLQPQGGRVGIGISAPTVPLEVGSFVDRDLGGGFWFTFSNESRQAGGGSHVNSISIKAAAGIQSSTGMFVTSDRRTKSNVERSNPISDLHILNQLQVTDYGFKDAATHGDKRKKGFIAQEVEKLFPQAVNKSTGAVPDIYKAATFKDGWVELATDLEKGARVRLIGEKADGIYEVLEVTKDKFRTDFKPEGDKIFVFGREVNDFRALDYDAISVLNVSATQELARRVAKLESREAHVAKLEQKAARVSILEVEVAELKQMVAQMIEAGKGTKRLAFDAKTSSEGL